MFLKVKDFYTLIDAVPNVKVKLSAISIYPLPPPPPKKKKSPRPLDESDRLPVRMHHRVASGMASTPQEAAVSKKRIELRITLHAWMCKVR